MGLFSGRTLASPRRGPSTRTRLSDPAEPPWPRRADALLRLRVELRTVAAAAAAPHLSARPGRASLTRTDAEKRAPEPPRAVTRRPLRPFAPRQRRGFRAGGEA